MVFSIWLVLLLFYYNFNLFGLQRPIDLKIHSAICNKCCIKEQQHNNNCKLFPGNIIISPNLVQGKHILLNALYNFW